MLTEETLKHGARVLARRDPDLRRVLSDYGPPPLWARAQGFPTLIHIILEQQVSLASAQAAFDRLRAACRGRITPKQVLKFDDAQMKAIGFSRQKMGYARLLAQAVIDKTLDVDALADMDDEGARAMLITQKGIGVWSADIYLLMALLRPDVWPHGDLALAVAVQEVKDLPTRPSYDELTMMSAAWHPWRAVAARLFWHHYLSRRRK